MLLRPLLAGATVLATAGVVAVIGLDAWILRVWAVVLAVGLVLAGLGYLLARELGSRGADRGDAQGGLPGLASETSAGRRANWIAGGMAAFISCTMAAGLVRSTQPVRDVWLLGALMLAAVVNLRVAYAKTA